MGPPPALSVSFHEHEGNTCALSRRYVEDRKEDGHQDDRDQAGSHRPSGSITISCAP